MKTHVLFLTLALLLAACSFPTPTPTPLPTQTLSWTVFPTLEVTPSFTPSATPLPVTGLPATVGSQLPGLVVRGRVTLDGVGLAGVSIIRQYSAYPGELVAVTDADGYYQSAFMGIPGDEMVAVHAELGGYTFDPQYCNWRHYFGYEERTCDFTALLTP